MPSITDSIGRVLGDRYRLVTPLGTGASAHVYLADDVSLHRRVAIKILHPALAGDSAFLKRFRAEAVAVAALNHPNILQVYDWGEEDDEPYLVLEYLGGGSLRQIYDTGALLTPQQAVQIGIQATNGLDYAHRRGLIHRDIKPANLLFDSDGRLRIADFGLARALAEAAWTEPDGAILGTARYAAPEQVEGFVLDGKADVYALALVLYEGVTGETPFIGDTTVATLMARVGSLLPEHKGLGPLNDVLVWAAAPDPAERLDAAEFGRQLVTLADELPTAAPIPIVDSVPAGEFEDLDKVMIRPSRRPDVGSRGPDLTELGAPALIGAAAGAEPKKKPTSGKKNGTDPVAAARRRRRRWPWITAVVVVVAGLVTGGLLLASKTKLFTPTHPVPVLVGQTLAAAQKSVHHDHFTVRSTGNAYSTTIGTGLIVSQHPVTRSKGKPVRIKQGSTISVVLSSGPPPVAIPNLTTFTSCNDAIQALQAVHLVGSCPPAAAQYSSTVAAGGILGTTPATTALYGSAVTIVTSKGHAPVAVPTVAGATATYATAAAALTAAGFAPAQAKAYSSTVPSGQVIGTTPAAGTTVLFGSTVTVSISLGPQPVAIPNVVGQSVAAATAALQAAGLKPSGPYGPAGSTNELSLDPPAGTTVLPGTTVNIYTL
jgi:serine/threonine protein kinase/beta-lactam-binding protein with PASTA domain